MGVPHGQGGTELPQPTDHIRGPPWVQPASQPPLFLESSEPQVTLMWSGVFSHSLEVAGWSWLDPQWSGRGSGAEVF